MDDRLSGWVPGEQLAFGHDMDQIKSAFPQKILREEYQGRPMYASPDMQSTALLEEGAWMVGTAGDSLYILLTSMGDTFFAPQAWFEEGHGCQAVPFFIPCCSFDAFQPFVRHVQQRGGFIFHPSLRRHAPQGFQQAAHLPRGYAPCGQQRHQRVPADGQLPE